MTTSWKLLATGSGGTVASLACARQSDNQYIVLAATPIGLFVSRNAGESWSGLGAGFAHPSVDVVAASPDFAQDQTLFAGTTDALYLSHDAGTSWRPRLRGSRMNGIAVSPGFADDRLIFAGTETDGVLRSGDGGVSWSSSNPGLLELTVLSIELSPNFVRDQTGFVTTDSALYRTRNGGQSWREMDTGLDEPAVQCLAISPEFASDRLVLGGTEAEGLLVSTDSGTNWDVPDELSGRSVTAVAFVNGVDDDRPIVAATDLGLYISRDQGATWELSEPQLDSLLSFVTVHQDSCDVLLGGQFRDGVVRSCDRGRSWSRSNAGLRANLLVDLVASPSFSEDYRLFLADLERGVLTSTDGGTNWEERNRGIDAARVFNLSILGSTLIYAATSDGVYRSDNAGANWHRVLQSDNPMLAVTCSTGSASGHVTLFAASSDGSVYSSRDHGESWSQCSPLGVAVSSITIALSPDFTEDGHVFLAASSPAENLNEFNATIWHSTDAGESWNELRSDRGGSVVPLAVSPDYSNDRTVVVGYGGKLLALSVAAADAGPSESAVLADLSFPTGTSTITDICIRQSPQSSWYIFVSSNTGVYRSGELGSDVRDWSDGLDKAPVVSLAVIGDETGNPVVYAGGLGGGIHRRVDDGSSD